MIPVLTRAQMRAFDAHAITECKVPSLLLMENAGRGATDVIVREALQGRTRGARAVVVCGTGNNGGDGFVVARHLTTRGVNVVTWVIGALDKLTPDAKANHEALLGVGGSVVASAGLNLEALQNAVSSADVVVDALFGTGLDRPVGSPYGNVVAVINRAVAKKVALDVPTGLNADTGSPQGATVIADMTVTFGHLKFGLLTSRGASFAGRVFVADIGVPGTLVDVVGQAAQLIERSDVAAWFSPRSLDAHKYSVGHVAVLGGSPGKVGASLMVAHAALRAGAGAATIATWPSSAPAIEARVVEVMSARLAPDKLGPSIDAALAGKRAVVVGPGFGLGEESRAAVAHVLATFSGPVVVDADALTVFSKKPEAFADAKGSPVLTPHAGELARLLDTSSEAIESDRLSAACTAAERAQAVVVLKGPSTLIAAPDRRVCVNSTGNPALATAGSGDVLAGIIGALSCSMGTFEAACAGVYVHGLAADAWMQTRADRGLLASEIADQVPGIIGALAREGGAGASADAGIVIQALGPSSRPPPADVP
jgi:NAD(P)H-hydrate epimerase